MVFRILLLGLLRYTFSKKPELLSVWRLSYTHQNVILLGSTRHYAWIPFYSSFCRLTLWVPTQFLSFKFQPAWGLPCMSQGHWHSLVTNSKLTHYRLPHPFHNTIQDCFFSCESLTHLCHLTFLRPWTGLIISDSRGPSNFFFYCKVSTHPLFFSVILFSLLAVFSPHQTGSVL